MLFFKESDTKEVTFEKESEGNEEGSCGDNWGQASQAEGTQVQRPRSGSVHHHVPRGVNKEECGRKWSGGIINTHDTIETFQVNVNFTWNTFRIPSFQMGRWRYKEVPRVTHPASSRKGI